MFSDTAVASRARYASRSTVSSYPTLTFDGVMPEERAGSGFGRLYDPVRVMVVRFGRRRMMRALSLGCLERMGYDPDYVQAEILKPFWRE